MLRRGRKRLTTLNGPRFLDIPEGREGEKTGEMTRQLDTSIKAGQGKPGLEMISKLSTRGSRGKTRVGVAAKTQTCVFVCVCVYIYCVCVVVCVVIACLRVFA